MTNKSQIREWLHEAKEQGGITHVIIVCDTFDFDDYPRHVRACDNVREVVKEIDGKEMQRVEEVYDLSLDLEEQLNEARALHY
jgi:hypothetical protein